MTSIASRHQTADNPPVGGGRRAVVLVIAAACVLLPGLLGVLIFKSDDGGDPRLAGNDQTAPVVETTTDGPPTDTAADVEPTAGAGGAAAPEVGEGGAPTPPDEPEAPATAAPTVVGGPLPTARGTGRMPPPPPPPPTSDAKKKPPPSSSEDKGKGTLVAIAVGGTCAFSVNGASKGTTTTLKLSVDPGTYSVSCKPASGGTKSRTVRVKSGATAMAMFKL